MELGLSKLAKALVGVALAASVLAGGTAPAPVSTTFHHPFYDITQAAFVDAVGLKVGDHLQTADGGEATVENVTPYHSTEMTYDLTIGQLHTYYVEAGDTPILVHNCGTTDVYRTAKLGNGVDERAKRS